MKSYNSYKSSEIDWIDQIPSHWSEKRIKYLFSEKPSTQNTDLNSGSISFGSVVYKDDNSIPESTKLSYQEVLVGEFLVNPLNLNYDLKSLRTALSDKNVVVSQGYIVLRLEERETDQYFFKHLLRVFDVEHMKSLGSGVRQTISFNHLGTEALPLPPIKEQKAIASFLDTKTSLIDSLIEKTQRKIELLKEKRTSLINEVVTKGLNPNVEMKDSGVEWIGTMPNNWVKKKVSWISKVASGTTPKSDNKEYYENGTVKWLNTGDLNDGFLSTTKKLITQKAVDDCKLKQYSSYSVVVAMYGATIGKTSVITEPMTVNQACCVINDIKEVSSTWVYYVFLASKSNLIFQGEGGGQPNINQETIRSHFVTIPPLSEQNRILTFLNEQTELIDKSVSIEEERIKLLKEYRQSLISSVVTGKIKVTEDA
jgi:type I restriction enzyme S subunit